MYRLFILHPTKNAKEISVCLNKERALQIMESLHPVIQPYLRVYYDPMEV